MDEEVVSMLRRTAVITVSTAATVMAFRFALALVV